ncbi:MAG TPA: hypothetical protein VF605_00370 [Allosphingosinicella sp.]|jgi:hypothetical protein
MALREALLLVAGGAVLLGGCDWMKKKDPPQAQSKAELAAAQRERIRKACASDGTYARLKELVFDEAARIRKSDPRNLDPLAAAAVVRMEDPVVKSRDDALNVTVCTGHFVLELPPGVENAFDGERRLTADVEYAAQAALDGSGLVYQMDGAEPIIYRLATVGLTGQPLPKIVAAPQPSAPPGAPPQVAIVEPAEPVRPLPPAEPPRPAAEKRAAAEPAPPPTRVKARPSFNCRHARTGTEKLICGSPRLAARDREMASLWYALMADADPATRGHLRRSRDAFLGRRERCGSESCVDSAYASRMAELRRIAQGD